MSLSYLEIGVGTIGSFSAWKSFNTRNLILGSFSAWKSFNTRNLILIHSKMDVLEEETNSEISKAMRPLNSSGEIPNQRVDQPLTWVGSWQCLGALTALPFCFRPC